MTARFWMAAAVCFAFAGALSAASDAIARPCGAGAAPSSFDYLVLASMADSQHPISMLSYRPPRLDDRNPP